MHRFANPARFQRLSAVVLPVAAGAAVVLLVLGLYLALAGSPADYQQGETVRIMYVHVPAAWMGLAIYGAMAVASATGLVWRHPLADLFTKAAAPVGAGFTAICLVSGALWGAPMWGTWWVWDARLTSVLVLFFLYLGYLALVNAFDDPNRGARAGGVLVLVGAINLPIIKFSVDWWNTLHQPASVLRMGGPAIDPAMLWPLMVMALAFAACFVSLVLLRLRAEIALRKVQMIRLAQAHAAQYTGS
ncbi:heme ABC transporter permease [Arenibaculum pallidiluteum]|uniref:heme ABC transporter permease n=1 Tax=Arenibaculum pallidiluteum TaxID=2812559 RepID=UPI001A97BCCA|nr:heme ABC transporter permease [Arenibaculum pallidiluteum]